jgi:hypothetical protein
MFWPDQATTTDVAADVGLKDWGQQAQNTLLLLVTNTRGCVVIFSMRGKTRPDTSVEDVNTAAWLCTPATTSRLRLATRHNITLQACLCLGRHPRHADDTQ